MDFRVGIWIVILVWLLIWGWKLLNWIWLKPKKLEKCLRQQGFAGNPYRLYSGDTKLRTAMMNHANSKPINFSHHIAPRVIPSIYHTIHKYGKNSFMWLGPYPRAHIMEPQELKAALSLINDIQKPSINPLVRLLIGGLINYEGPKWIKHRKIVNPAFHLEKLKEMVPRMLESCNEMISQWETMIPKHGSNCELDVMPHLQNFAADVISRTAFGSSYEEGKIIFQHLREWVNLVLKASSSVYIPGSRFLPTKSNNRMKKLSKEIKAVLLYVINKRQRAMKAGKEIQADLLSILLESNMNEIEEHGNKDVGMSIEEVMEECKLFYLAGQETTAVLLVWTIILLASYPKWQQLARQEVLQVFAHNKPDFDALNRLKVVTMILNEVLRLYPPAGVFTRLVQNETKLGKLTLPAGMLLCFPIVLIHHDPKIWGEDAHEFNPQRFAEGVSKATKNQIGFFPFGWGPRICIGQNFAMIEAKLAIAMILQHFSFELSSSYAHAPSSILTIQPQHGAHIILHKL